MTTTEILADSETVRLYGWADWQDAQTTVRALLFGEMVKRAAPIITHYHSDLFHDADWLVQHVHGPCEFLWMARLWGTNIGNSAQVQERISGTEPRTLWHVALTETRGDWSVTFSVLVRVTD